MISELPNGDYAYTIARQFLFSTWYGLYLEKLCHSKDAFLAGFAEKSIKEVRYHLQHSRDWVIRMGDGTEESHARAQAAIDHLWRYTHELFYEDAIDAELQAAAQVPSLKAIETSWLETVKAVFAEATLEIPANNWKFDGGRQGRHSEHMGYLLAELQYMQRAYPNMQW